MPYVNCTWRGCLCDAVRPQVATDHTVWANLCAAHDAELGRLVRSGEPAKITRAWVLAQGGAERATDRFFGRAP